MERIKLLANLNRDTLAISPNTLNSAEAVVLLAAVSAGRQLLSGSLARCLPGEDRVHDLGSGGEDGA